MAAEKEISVIDTSSIIQVRDLVPKSERNGVFDSLGDLVEQGTLIFPVEVFHELSRFYNSDSDPPYKWAKNYKKRATRYGPQHEMLKVVLSHPHASRVLDLEKVGVEEADVHVLAVALALKDEFSITVLTEETRDRPDKLSMATACGHLRLIRLPIEAFLAKQNIWQRKP